jgi:hypothetical protein
MNEWIKKKRYIQDEVLFSHKEEQNARSWWLMPITSYSGGRDQEDYGSKPARGNSL